MDQEWHPQPWVHCPESQDTLWDTEEELPRTVYDFLDGFYRNKEVAKWKGLHDPRSMVKSKTEGQEDKHFNKFLVSEFDRVWKFHCLINFLKFFFSWMNDSPFPVCAYETLSGSQKPHSAAPPPPLPAVHREKTDWGMSWAEIQGDHTPVTTMGKTD